MVVSLVIIASERDIEIGYARVAGEARRARRARRGATFFDLVHT